MIFVPVSWYGDWDTESGFRMCDVGNKISISAIEVGVITKENHERTVAFSIKRKEVRGIKRNEKTVIPTQPNTSVLVHGKP